MAFEGAPIKFVVGVILALGAVGLLFSYLQVHRGFRIRSRFARPKLGILGRLKSRPSPFTKFWIAYRWFYVRMIYRATRSLFTRPELSLTILALVPSAAVVGYWIRNGLSTEPLVLATLFYASVIFFKEFFLADYPLIELNRTLHIKDDRELKVDYTVSNIGSKPISNLILSHAVYDGNGRWLRGTPEPLGYKHQTPVSLDPGENSEEFRVPLEKSIGFGYETNENEKWNIMEEDTPTPIYIEIAAFPSIGHRFLGDREIIRYDPNPDKEPLREAWRGA